MLMKLLLTCVRCSDERWTLLCELKLFWGSRLLNCGLSRISCFSLEPALKSSSSYLIELDLSGNKLQHSDIKQLFNLTTNSKYKLRTLRSVRCSYVHTPLCRSNCFLLFYWWLLGLSCFLCRWESFWEAEPLLMMHRDEDTPPSLSFGTDVNRSGIRLDYWRTAEDVCFSFEVLKPVFIYTI